MKNAFAIAIALALLLGCHKNRDSSDSGAYSMDKTDLTWRQRPVLETHMQELVQNFRQQDPTIRRFFDDSNGVIIFTNIYKAPGVTGGLFGRGEAFEQGRIAGNATIFQKTGPFVTPNPYYRQIIIFKHKSDFECYKRYGRLVLTPQDIGIALRGGSAAKAEYVNGLVIFVMSDAGGMENISCANQILTYARVPD